VKVGKASGRRGETANGRTEAQGWWGEAPALALIFAKSLAGFDLWSARQIRCRADAEMRLGLGDRFQGWQTKATARQRICPIRHIWGEYNSPCEALESVPEPRPTNGLHRSDRLLAGKLG
jgi:hypothetical protein